MSKWEDYEPSTCKPDHRRHSGKHQNYPNFIPPHSIVIDDRVVTVSSLFGVTPGPLSYWVQGLVQC